MSACCDATSHRKAPPWVRSVREISAWLLPGATLALMPKCPACLAAYFALWTGLGLSFTTASWLRMVLLALCIASFLHLVVTRLGRFRVG